MLLEDKLYPKVMQVCWSVSADVLTGFMFHLRVLQTSDESDTWVSQDASTLVELGSSRCNVVDLPAGGAASLLCVPGGGVLQAAVGVSAVRGAGGLFAGPEAPPGAPAEPGERSFSTSHPCSAPAGFSADSASIQQETKSKQHQEAVHLSRNNHNVW